jgi:hypothetical protein
VQRALSSPTFRLYQSDDVVGVELAGAKTSWRSPRESSPGLASGEHPPRR